MNRTQSQHLIGAMESEIRRSMHRLRAPRHPKPYYISYLVRDVRSVNIWARYGALYQDKQEHRRSCYTDVRVGSYKYDQTSRGGLSDGEAEQETTESIDLPLEGNMDSVRFCLWRLTDAKFRDAVSKFHGKKSRDVSYLDQYRGLPSFERLKKQVSIKPLRKFAIDVEAWRDYVKKASNVFKRYPEIKSSFVEFNVEWTNKIFVDSEGVVRVWQEPVYELSAYFWYHSKRLDQDFSITRHVTKESELPELLDFCREIRTRIQQFQDLEEGETMTSFTGPVLMAPRAAGLFLHEVLGHRLEGNRLLSESEGRTFQDKLGQKIMHQDLNIYDDPSLKSWQGQTLVGHYPFDDEGTPAKRASLVEKGVLKGFLTTRSPLTKTDHVSNGHARNQGEERPISRMANLIVESRSKNTWADLKSKLMDEIKRQNVPFGIILLDVEGGETETEAYNFQAFMGQITRAVKVYANGKEKYVKGVDFVGTPLNSLSQILAVGCEYEVDNGYCGAESGTVPVSTVAPAILMSSLELQAKSPSKVAPYAMPLPWFEQEDKRAKAGRKLARKPRKR